MIYRLSCRYCSVAKSYLTLCNPMDYSMSGFPKLHCLPKLAQIHIHWVTDAIQPSQPLLPLSPPALNLSQHQGHFQWVSSSYQVAKVLELQLQHQLFQWIFRTDLLQNGLVGSPYSPRDSQESSPTPQFKSINSSAVSLLYCPTLIFIHDSWKNHSFNILVGKVMSLLQITADSDCSHEIKRRLLLGRKSMTNLDIILPTRICIASLLRKQLLILWLQPLSSVILKPKKIIPTTVSTFSPSINHKVMEPDAMILGFWMLSFKPVFQLFSFILIKRLFSSSSLSATEWL